MGDAFAGSHRFANPVIRVAVDENPVMAGLHINTAKKFVDIGEFGLFLANLAEQTGQFRLALQVVKGFLADSQCVGTRDGQRLRSNVATVAQGGVIEREKYLPLFDWLIWLNVEGFDDAFSRRRHHFGFEGDDFCRGDHR